MTLGSNNPQNTDDQDKHIFFTCFDSEILYVVCVYISVVYESKHEVKIPRNIFGTEKV